MNNGTRDSPGSSWLVQVPLADLLALQNMVGEMDKLRAENVQLRKRIEGLHSTLYSTMEIVNELKRQVSTCRIA